MMAVAHVVGKDQSQCSHINVQYLSPNIGLFFGDQTKPAATEAKRWAMLGGLYRYALICANSQSCVLRDLIQNLLFPLSLNICPQSFGSDMANGCIQILGCMSATAGLICLTVATYASEWKLLSHAAEGMVKSVVVRVGLWMACSMPVSRRWECTVYDNVLHVPSKFLYPCIACILSVYTIG